MNNNSFYAMTAIAEQRRKEQRDEAGRFSLVRKLRRARKVRQGRTTNPGRSRGASYPGIARVV